MEMAIIREKKIKGGSRKNKIKLIETQNPTWLDLYENICGYNTGLLRQPMAASQRRMIDSLCTTVVNSSRESGATLRNTLPVTQAYRSVNACCLVFKIGLKI